MIARAYLENIHLDYFNNYLTPEKFADHNGLNPDQARALLALAKLVYDTPHPEA